TNHNGEFALDTKKGDILKFSYLGYSTQEVLIGSQREIFISLDVDASDLNEVVEIVQLEEDTAIPTMQMMAPPPPPSAELIELSGKVSGVSLQNSDGSGQVILGYSSISGADAPLFIVDGEIVTE